MIRPSQNRDGRFFEGARDPADRVGGEGLEAARASMIGEITKRARVTEQGMTNCPHPTVMRRRQWPFRASSPNRSSRLMLARRRGPGGAASFGGERRLVECPHGKPISPPRAGKCSDETAAPHGRLARLGRDLETVAYLPRNRKFESIPLQRRVFCELGF